MHMNSFTDGLDAIHASVRRDKSPGETPIHTSVGRAERSREADGLDALHASVRRDKSPGETPIHTSAGRAERGREADGLDAMHASVRRGEARCLTHTSPRPDRNRAVGAKHHHQLEGVKLKLTGRGFGDFHDVGFAGVRGHADRARPW